MADERSVMAVIRAARPSFRNNADKVVFSLHASFLAAGYVLTATGATAFSDDALSSSSTDEVAIDQWNDSENEYAFVYWNPEKGGKKVLVKCLVMNGKLLVDALADGPPDPLHLEIDIEDFVGENGGANYSAQFKNMDKLVKKIDSEILSKLNDSFSKAGSSSNRPRDSQTSDGWRRGIAEPGVRITEPGGPQIDRSGIVYPAVNPIGGSDLFPGPGAGIYPTRGGLDHGGSMLLGPNDPRWFGREPNFPGGLPGVPPGARFDPYGPPGIPGFEPNRFVRNPQRPGSHPDLEHFRDGSGFI